MEIIRPPSKQPIPTHAKKVFSGVMFEFYQWEQELFDGTKAIFEKVKRPDTVVIFPVLPDGRILLTEQEQPGKGKFVGTTGGRVDEGEDILQAAQRELLEESGYQASDLILWDAYQPSAKIDWAIYTFVAKGLKKVADMNLDGGEKIVLKPVTFEEFLDIVISNNFEDKQIIEKIYEAKLDPEKYKELCLLFKPL